MSEPDSAPSQADAPAVAPAGPRPRAADEFELISRRMAALRGGCRCYLPRDRDGAVIQAHAVTSPHCALHGVPPVAAAG